MASTKDDPPTGRDHSKDVMGNEFWSIVPDNGIV
eukprot:CAMPEP_0170758916 /NCGR_PEP_ID=MMETSP0733-20121128/609_1 /TAXON_ID=186038 /ORGANISM="Fragilariopsis kerguelensis, Strain L26-C5" /LENGTH=33 /DNA_ID= /DNA_START= /DNA_END= /DNA_ORIENTATION=